MNLNNYVGNIVRHRKRQTFYTIVSAATFNAVDDDLELFDRKPVFFYLDLDGKTEPQARLASEMIDGRFEFVYRGNLRINKISKHLKRQMQFQSHNGPHDTLRHMISKFNGVIFPNQNLVTFEDAISANVATAAIDFIQHHNRIMTALGAMSRMNYKRLDTFDCFFGAMMYLDMHWYDAARFASAATDPNTTMKATFKSSSGFEVEHGEGMGIIQNTWSKHFP